MARDGSGVYSLPAGSNITNGDTSDASDINTPLNDIETDLNTARPIVAGGTGATSASAARTNLDVWSIQEVKDYKPRAIENTEITSPVSTIEFDNTNGAFDIDGDLQPDRIFINFRNVFPSVDGAELFFRASTDGGLNWLDSAGDYVLVSSNVLTGSTFDKMTLCTDVGNASMEGIWRGALTLYPDHSTHDKWIVESAFLRVKSSVAGELLFYSNRGYINTTSPITAVQAFWSSGNFTSGYSYTEKLYQLPSQF